MRALSPDSHISSSLHHALQGVMPERSEPLYVPKAYGLDYAGPTHPLMNEAGQILTSWLSGYNLFGSQETLLRFLKAGFHELIGRTHWAACEDDLNLITAWLGWIYVVDDRFDETRSGRDPLLVKKFSRQVFMMLVDDVPERAGEDPFLRALDELWQRTKNRSSIKWQQRFVSYLGEYFDTIAWECENRNARRIPDLVEFCDMRRQAGGMVFVAFYELIHGIDLPEPLLMSGTIRRLQSIAMDVTGWINDIGSLNKEIAAGDVNNFVLVVEQTLCLGRPAAIKMIGRLIDERNQEFFNECHALCADKQPPFVRSSISEYRWYLDGLSSWIAGNVYWAQRSPRYSANF